MIKDYDKYKYSIQEKSKYLSLGIFTSVVIGFLLYKNIIGIIIISPFTIFILKNKKKSLIKERKWQLNLEFRDGIESLLAGLNAGYSIEKALEGSLYDLKRIYDEESLIIMEFTYMVNRIKMNQTIEEVILDFGERSKVEDIRSFADILLSAKRTDGDLIKIIDSTCRTIGDKLEIDREIKTLYSAKKFEANIMRMMPLAILVYLMVFSPGYLDPLYGNLLGVVGMTVLFTIYLLAYFLIDKIMDIEI